MMKVVKKGRKQNGWAKEFKCSGDGNGGGGCGAILLVETLDLFSTSKSYADGSTDDCATFQCSECGVKTDLPDDETGYGRIVNIPTFQDWRKARL